MRLHERLLLQSWHLYRRLGLRPLTHKLLNGMPFVSRRVDRVKSELAILNRRRYTPPQPLFQHYVDVLKLLKERHGADGIGDYLEFGVYNGTSLTCMYRALNELNLSHVRLFGFDSFEGLPADEEGHWGNGGRFSCDIDTAKTILRREGVDLDRVTLVKGFYNQTLNESLIKQHGMRKASVVMVDCDLYRSAIECLAFSDRLIRDDAIVCFDDWYPLSEQNMGEKRAFDEYLSARPDLRATPLTSYCDAARTFLVSRGRP